MYASANVAVLQKSSHPQWLLKCKQNINTIKYKFVNLYVREMPRLKAVWNLDKITEVLSTTFRISTDSVTLDLEWKNKEIFQRR